MRRWWLIGSKIYTDLRSASDERLSIPCEHQRASRGTVHQRLAHSPGRWTTDSPGQRDWGSLSPGFLRLMRDERVWCGLNARPEHDGVCRVRPWPGLAGSKALQ